MNLVSVLPPLLGQITAIYLFLSPLQDIKKQRSKGVVTIDAVPFCVTLVQHVLWVVLAGLLHDIWIFTPNLIGTFSSVFCTTTALRFGIDGTAASKMEVVLCIGLGFSVLFVMFAMTPIFVESEEVRKTICGNVCIAICIAMYGSPCYEAVLAIKTKDASKISLAFAVAGSINGFFWGTYGFINGLMPVLIPNGLGCFLSLFNICVKLCCSSKLADMPDKNKGACTLSEALYEAETVLIQSVTHVVQLHVPLRVDQDCDLEAESNDVQVGSADIGIGVKMVHMPNEDESVETTRLKLCLNDGRFLCVQTMKASSHKQPSTFGLFAKNGDDVGDEGVFHAVSCAGMALDSSETRFVEYGKDTVCFWNPMHKVFLRVNEYGQFDCSPAWHSASLPKGWHWERFQLRTANTI